MTAMMPAPVATMTAMDMMTMTAVMPAPAATMTTMAVVVAEAEHGGHGGTRRRTEYDEDSRTHREQDC